MDIEIVKNYLEDNKINDNELFIILNDLLKNKCQVKDISIIEGLKEKYQQTYKMIIIRKEIMNIEKYLDDIVIKLKKNKSNISKYFKNIETINDLYIILKEHINAIINSFRDFEHTLMMVKDIEESKRIDSVNWKKVHEREILNRLESLLKIFGLDTLQFMELPIISMDRFLKLNYDGKMVYYISCINKLRSRINIVTNSILIHKKLSLSLEMIEKSIKNINREKVNKMIIELEKMIMKNKIK